MNVTSQNKNTESFQKVIRKIIKEEFQALKEESNPIFGRLSGKNLDNFKGWVLRQYFNPERNKNSNWYDPNVDESNVLDYISQASNNLPLSPKQFVDFFFSIKGLKSRMNSKEVSADLDDVELDDEDEDDKSTYQTGDVSLKNVGKELGGITPTMVNKIFSGSVDKLQSLTGGKHPNDLTPEDEAALEKRLTDAETSAAKEYAQMIVASGGNIGKLISDLSKRQILSPNEARSLSDREIEALIDMADMSAPAVAATLRRDLNNPRGNLIKSFQSFYSKTLFPSKKRGRPSKNG